MADVNVEAVAEPVVNAPSAEVKADDAAQAAPEAAEPAKDAAEVATENGTAAPKKERYNNNRDQNRAPRVFKKYESKSKFDPSKLPITDDPSEIRAQVRIVVPFHMLGRMLTVSRSTSTSVTRTSQPTST